jgi:hypothetical protein
VVLTNAMFGLRGHGLDFGLIFTNLQNTTKGNAWLWGQFELVFKKLPTTQALEAFDFGGLVYHIKLHAIDHK